MALTIIQPDESQTFLFKYGPYGEEHQFNAKEILQKMRDYYQQNFDSVVLLPYAYEAFGYFIAGCQIGSGSDDSMYLANEDYVTNSGSDHCIAVRPLYSNVMPMCAFNTDGTLSYSFGTVSMSTLYYGPPDGNTIWNIFNGNYSIPYVLYTECSCNHLYINGEEYKFGDATCKVTYFLPDDDYQYTKLTYKRDVQPESVNDGTIVNLDPTQDFVTVEGLVENANYWFKIFTSKSESEAFGYTVEVDPVPPEYREYIKCINGSKNYQNRHCYITYIKEWQFYPDSYDPQRTYYHGSILGKTIYSNPTNSGFTNVQSSSDKTAVAVGNSIISVRITSDNDVYRISTDNMTLDNSIFEYIYNSPRTCAFGVLTINTQQLSLSVYNGLNYNTASWLESGLAQTFNSLTSAFDFINASFRNIDIYVDGVLWSKAGK